jgi:hypothetical protein
MSIAGAELSGAPDKLVASPVCAFPCRTKSTSRETISARSARNRDSSRECLLEGDKEWHTPFGAFRAGRFAMTAIVRPREMERTVMSTITSKQSKADALVSVQALMAGTEKHFPNGSFTLGNVTYTTASLVQALKALADALTVLDAAHASTRDAVTARREAETKVAPLLRDYRNFLGATFSTANAQLADFGLAPPKARKPMTTEAKAAAAAKRRATRKLLGTKGTLQKKQAVKAAESALPTQTTLPKP